MPKRIQVKMNDGNPLARRLKEIHYLKRTQDSLNDGLVLYLPNQPVVKVESENPTEDLVKITLDVSGNNNHGTFLNNVKWGKNGKYYNLYFNGVNDYIFCAHNPSLNITDAITIILWVKPINNYTGNYQIFISKHYATAWGIGRRNNSNIFLYKNYFILFGISIYIYSWRLVSSCNDL